MIKGLPKEYKIVKGNVFLTDDYECLNSLGWYRDFILKCGDIIDLSQCDNNDLEICIDLLGLLRYG